MRLPCVQLSARKSRPYKAKSTRRNDRADFMTNELAEYQGPLERVDELARRDPKLHPGE